MLCIDTHYIDGRWVSPHGTATFTTINPATEEASGLLRLGDAVDVDLAVKAARQAFKTWSKTSLETRIDLLEAIKAGVARRRDEIGDAMTLEMGAKNSFARGDQVGVVLLHLAEAIRLLQTFEFSRPQGRTLIEMVPIGVCGLISPWNWPAGTLMAKVIPAIAAGCTVVVKPSEYTPYCAKILFEVMAEAGVPAGVVNLIYGDGPTVGEAMSLHSGIDMMSFTGSNRGGVAVARASAETVKRVHQELGGKSANIILPSADLEKAVTENVRAMTMNGAQNCTAATRMLVQNARMQDALAIAAQVAASLSIGTPSSNADLTVVANKAQFDRIQQMIQKGIDEGATLVCGGLGRPEGFDKGYYCKLTIFADTSPDMAVVKEEIFGPVLAIQGYDSEEEAIEIANDSEYGLAAYVQGALPDAQRVARELFAGQVYINSAADADFAAPFGGFKRSGNGREWGAAGLEAFMEPRAIVAYFNTTTTSAAS